MSGLIPVLPWVAAKSAAQGAGAAAGAIPDAAANAAGNAMGSLFAPLNNLFNGDRIKRYVVILFGVWIMYVGILIWIASNQNVQDAVTGAVTAAATKNPTAAVTAMGATT